MLYIVCTLFVITHLHPHSHPHTLTGVQDIGSAVWPSTEKVYTTIDGLADSSAKQKILTGNATRLLGL